MLYNNIMRISAFVSIFECVPDTIEESEKETKLSIQTGMSKLIAPTPKSGLTKRAGIS